MSKLKILSHYAHGTYQSELAKIPGVEFYHIVDTKNVFPAETRPKRSWGDGVLQPINVHAIEASDVNLADFHLMLIHWHPFIELFCDKWPTIPSIMCEHTWPFKNLQTEVGYWTKFRRHYLKHTVYITPSSMQAWGEEVGKYASYIYHAINTTDFPKKEEYTSDGDIVTLTNEFIKRDWACGFQLWSKVLELPNPKTFSKDKIALYGYGNENLGQQFARGPLDRSKVYEVLQKAAVYFNPSIMSPIPMSLLEAVSVGTPLVSTAYCEVGRLFKNNVHGIITNDIAELRDGLKYIINNPGKAEEMAHNAFQVVENTFKPEQFRHNWFKVLQKYAT